MTDQTAAMIKYGLERAETTLETARDIFGKGDFVSTVNRIYYAVFYAASAALLTRDYSSSKHSGVISMFTKEFVNQGLVEKNFGRFINQLFMRRQKGDYQYFVEFERAEVENWLRLAEKFINEVRKLIAADQKQDQGD